MSYSQNRFGAPASSSLYHQDGQYGAARYRTQAPASSTYEKPSGLEESRPAMGPSGVAEEGQWHMNVGSNSPAPSHRKPAKSTFLGMRSSQQTTQLMVLLFLVGFGASAVLGYKALHLGSENTRLRAAIEDATQEIAEAKEPTARLASLAKKIDADMNIAQGKCLAALHALEANITLVKAKNDGANKHLQALMKESAGIHDQMMSFIKREQALEDILLRAAKLYHNMEAEAVDTLNVAKGGHGLKLEDLEAEADAAHAQEAAARQAVKRQQVREQLQKLKERARAEAQAQREDVANSSAAA